MEPRFLLCILSMVFVISDAIIFSAIGAVSDVVSIVNDVKDFTESDDELNNGVDTDQIVADISARIELANDALYKRISLQLQLSKIENAAQEVYSSLVDLRFFLEAISGEREFYKEEFIENSSPVLSHVRFLPERLSETVPGSDNRILEYIAEHSRCNMSALEEFETFYLDLMKNGMIIDLLSRSLKETLTLDSETRFWEESFEKVIVIFNNENDGCKRQLSTFLREDIETAQSADIFWQENAERYSWLWNDVFISSKGIGSNVFFYDVNDDVALFSTTNGYHKIVVFGEKDKHNYSLPNSNFVPIGNLNNAETIAKSFKTNLCNKHVNVKAVIVYFDSQSTMPDVYFDPESIKQMVTLDEVQLSYNGADIRGKFNVYLVMAESGECVLNDKSDTAGETEEDAEGNKLLYVYIGAGCGGLALVACVYFFFRRKRR